jgi:PAS domain S-box-containing protein
MGTPFASRYTFMNIPRVQRDDQVVSDRDILNRPRSSSHQALVRAVLTHSATLLEPENLDGLFLRALTTAREFLTLDACQIATLRADGTHVDVYGSDLQGKVEHRSCEATLGLLAVALRAEEPILLGPAELECATQTAGDATLLYFRPNAAALLPLRGSTGRVIGALMCSTASRAAYTPGELTSMRMFAVQLGASLELLRARDDLRHWHAIVQYSQTAIMGKDQHGMITHWNPAAEQLYGYAAHEVLGKSIQLLVPADKREELEAILATIRRGQNISQLETVRLTKDGRRIEVSLNISVIRDASSQIVGASIMARDNTANKRANERFRLAVESAPNAMVLTDERGRILLINAEAERLFGYTRDELVGRTIEVLLPHQVRGAHREHRAGFMGMPHKRAMGAGRDLWALSKNGDQIPVEVGLNPIQGESERTVLASIVDISERRKIEKDRQRLLLDAQQAVEARDAFLSVASHELKTPLTALQLTTQALLRTAKNPQRTLTAETLIDKLSAANRQVSRLASLIDQLLDVSRLTAGPLLLEPTHADLSQVLQDVVERFTQSTDNCTIRPPQLTPLWGYWDVGRIEQIFTNLIANAVKYGEGQPIDVEVSEGADFVQVAIIDRGRGIAPEDQARIFQRFERLVSHRQFGGFGLGLWIVRQLVESHKGRIEVHSQPEQGSTFLVTLPRHQELV